jgi:hypothetical protein
MRFLFRQSAVDATGLLRLPWDQPLEQWDPGLLVELPQRGISRHVVRFVADGGHLFALKETSERLARKEYALLGRFEEEGLPTVSVVGVCVGRPHGREAILITRYLEDSVSCRWLFSRPGRAHPADRLLDAIVRLLVRLHLAGVFWGDCSLSNTLVRSDGRGLTAYLVDVETGERHPALSRGQRAHDVDLARERVGGEMLDLRFGGLLPEDIDPVETAISLPPRYEALWEEVTHEQVFSVEEQQYRLTERLQRLNDLGFDVAEVELVTSPEGAKLRVHTRVAEPGQHRRELFRLTGLEVQEGQARRLLNDIHAYRVHLEQTTGQPVPETVAAHRWVVEIYKRVIDAIPADLAGRLAPAEVFHEVLEHRWFLSEQARRDVGTAEAARSYFDNVLPQTPKEITTPSVIAGLLPDD